MNIWTIAVFEFKRYFKWKQEFIAIGMMLLGIGFSMAWPMMKNAMNKDYQVAVVGESLLPKVDGFQFSQISPDVKETVLQGLGDTWHAVVQVDNSDVTLTVKEKASWQGKLQSSLQTWQQQRQIEALPLSDQQRKVISELPKIILVTLKKEVVNESEKGKKLISGALLFLLTLGIFSGFGYMFTGITSEKQNRVTEQLLTLITPSQWIEGKILGISLFCLKTMVSFGVIAFVMVQVIMMMKGKPALTLPMSAFEFFSAILFTTLGLLLVNSFMAGFAATIDDPNHSSRSIVMFLPSIPVILAYSGIDNAEGMMMQVLSMFPLTSFAAMPLRMAHTDVPWWQWLISVSLLLLCLWWLKSAATRIFTLGIRMYGKEPKWSEMIEHFLFPMKK